MQEILICLEEIELKGQLFDTPCAKAIAEKLPIEAIPEEWGDEFYFEIPVTFPLDETSTVEVKVGDIGYWPPGRALAIFFGPTPISRGPDPVPASAVNLVGKIIGDPTILREAKGARKIILKRA
ncbi:MAG: cyclophilin-like fold protein [Thermodesulfovibrionales bacterium]|nr:cyclophilin-like fold protein [Thermodesulfovibrionales bacterium]